MNDCARLWQNKECSFKTTEDCLLENNECLFYVSPEEKALEVLKEERLAITTIYDAPMMGYEKVWNALDIAIKALEQVSKTGHWTYIRNSEVNGLKIVECSECGKRTYGSGNYCPNCGARMAE